ncbi:MAG: membrane protein insertase YidC, partial [Rhodospirillales bacterium]
MIDNKNLILAVVLSVAVLLGFELYFKDTRPTPQVAQTTEGTAPDQAPARSAGTPGDAAAVLPQVPGGTQAPQMAPQARRAEVLAASPRVAISTPRLTGSISLKGGRIDDLILADYRETLDKSSPAITLFTPRGAGRAYFAEFGWIASAAKNGGTAPKVPDAETVWTASATTLTPETPVTLSWDNGQGLVFTRTYEIDKNFMFKISQAVANKGTTPVELFPYGLVSRQGTPETSGFYILHEGLLGVNGGELK